MGHGTWDTLGPALAIVAVGGLYLAATRRPDPVPGLGRAPLPAAFAHTIVPIAAGYAIAHCFSLLLFDGQQTLVLASDPLGHGADLFGAAGRTVGYTVVGTTTIAFVSSDRSSSVTSSRRSAPTTARCRCCLRPSPSGSRTHWPLRW